MQTLFDKVNQGSVNQLDALDIALSLCCLIEDSTQFTHLDPTRINLDEDNQVSLLREVGAADCFYAAPDVVLHGAAPSKESMWFSMGCLLFFMLNGKSYCDAYDLDPIDIAETRPNTCLIDTDHYDGRASDVVSALTSWDPEARVEGVARLLQLLGTVPANLTLHYTLNDQIVFSQQIDIREDISNYRNGERITADDGRSYTILPGANVKFRPGHHTLRIPVAPGDTGGVPGPDTQPGTMPQAEPETEVKVTWMIMTFPNVSDPGRPIAVRVMPLNEESQFKLLPVSLLHKTNYQFIAVDFDEDGRPVGRKELFNLNVPADPQLKRAFLSVRYHVKPKGFSVVLCDQNRRPLSNANHFQMR